eukprot:TRINITY_DN9106_c0_g1_i2.p1 TRINITY_DN9106_c0_g1~~TRINITY_DN9106_c0_g1_i2.p1  ORF type:complete len:365 (+),score=88.98 TRINITY_DN9106_c0_g1_i2:72-1166(+)
MLSWGILGCAGIAQKFCVSVSESGNSKVGAVASRSKQRAEEFIGAHCPGATAYGSYDELLQDDSVQAVYIPVPTGLRTELALKAAAAKKHLLVEKPLASAAELQRIVDACKQAGVQLMDNTMFVHHSRQGLMRSAIDDGEVFGPVKHVHSTFSIPFGNDPNWARDNVRMQQSLEPLGCLGDLGWYNVRFTLWVYGFAEPESVSCNFIEKTSEGVPTHVVANLRFGEGKTASLMCSFRAGLHQAAEVVGEKSVLQLDDFVVTSSLERTSFRVIRCGIGDRALVFPSEEVLRRETGPCSQHSEAVKTFCNLASSGKVDESWPQQSMQTQVVLDAMVLSAQRDGAWVQTEEVKKSIASESLSSCDVL